MFKSREIYYKFMCFSFWKDWEKPENIPDPDAKKPDDWDDEMDGEWEPPMVTNPEYKVRSRNRQAIVQQISSVVSQSRDLEQNHVTTILNYH